MSEKDSTLVIEKNPLDEAKVLDLIKKANADLVKQLMEKITPAQEPDSDAQASDNDIEPEDYRVKLVENLKHCPKMESDAKSDWKYSDHRDAEDLKKIVGEVALTKEKQAEFKEAIGAVTATNAIPEIWSAEVSRGCRYPESAFWEASFIDWRKDLYGKPGDTVNIITVGAVDCVDFACEEPTSTAASIGKVPCVLVEKGCAYYICKQDIEDIVPDTIDALNEGLGRCLAQCIDNYFLGQAMITNSGTYDAGTCLTGAEIACVMGSMRAGTCEPVALIVHPVVEAALLQDSQFTNAATFGNRDNISTGHVYNWLGLDIIAIPKGTLVSGGDAISGGTYYSLLLAQDAMAGAKKREIQIESEYVVRLRRKYVLASARFCGTVVHDEGVWWIQSIEDCTCA
jgi:hypothetical protein